MRAQRTNALKLLRLAGVYAWRRLLTKLGSFRRDELVVRMAGDDS